MVRALVVDDSRIMRMVIRKHLRACGVPDASILEAANGHEALDRVGAEPVRLLVSDVNMPVMDGEALIDELSAARWFERGHAVMVTSRYERGLFRRLLHGGASTIIRKPFSTDGFLRQMEPILQEIYDSGIEAAVYDASKAPELPETPMTVPSPEPGGPPQQALGVALVHVLHTTGIRAQAVPTEAVDSSHFLAEVQVGLPSPTGLLVMADPAACTTIGERLTGMLPIDDELRADAVGELANVVAGVWSAAQGRSSGFSTPQVTRLSSQEVVWQGLMAFELEGGGRVYATTMR